MIGNISVSLLVIFCRLRFCTKKIGPDIKYLCSGYRFLRIGRFVGLVSCAQSDRHSNGPMHLPKSARQLEASCKLAFSAWLAVTTKTS